VLGANFIRSTIFEVPKAFALAVTAMNKVELDGRVLAGPEDKVNAPLIMIISLVLGE
jgi:hypothetical protein